MIAATLIGLLTLAILFYLVIFFRSLKAARQLNAFLAYWDQTAEFTYPDPIERAAVRQHIIDTFTQAHTEDTAEWAKTLVK